MRFLARVLGFTLLLGLTGSGLAFADGAAGATTQAPPQGAVMEGQPQLHGASDFIGLNVHDSKGREVGMVRELLLDAEENRIAYAEVGVGEDTYLIPWAAISSPHEGPLLTTDADLETITSAPVRRQEQLDEESARALHEHYGVAPYWDADQAREFSPPEARKSRPWADLPGQTTTPTPRPPLGGGSGEQGR